jgi:hypothetical protein
MKKSTWILFGLVLVLGLIYAVTKQEKVSVGIKRLKLPSINSQVADKIEITGKYAVTLLKKNNVWFLEIGGKDAAKKTVRASKESIETFFDAAKRVRHSYFVTQLAQKHKDLGLSTEQKDSIKIIHGDKILWGIELGTNAKGAGRYAKLLNDDSVYVLKGSFWQLTKSGSSDWRAKDLITIQESTVESFVSLQGSKVAVSAKRDDSEDKWLLAKEQSKSNFRLNSDKLSRLVKAALSISASGFVDDLAQIKKHQKKLKIPDLSIILTSKDKTTQKIELFKISDDKKWAKKSGVDQIFEVSNYTFKRLNKSASDLRDLTVMKFDPNRIKKLIVNEGKKKIILQKEESGWEIIQPKKLPMEFDFDPKAVTEKLRSLNGLKAKKIVARVPGLKTMIELVDENGEIASLLVKKNNVNRDEIFVRGNLDNLTYIASSATIEPFLGGVKIFEREEFELPPIDENSPGLNSLPSEVREKLLNAVRKRK